MADHSRAEDFWLTRLIGSHYQGSVITRFKEITWIYIKNPGDIH